MYRFLAATVDLIRAAFRKIGLSIQLAPLPRGIRDEDLYDPRYQPWRSPEWRERLRKDDPRSLVPVDRKYVLITLLEIALKQRQGDVAECGVYKGGTAYLFADAMRGSGKRLCLFDTFEGMPDPNPREDLHRKGAFSDTSIDGVKTYLRGFDGIEYFPGLVPASLAPVGDRTFCFVHVDLDLYEAIRSASAFFYSRVPPGGYIIYDDYGAGDCPGARKAVDEFYADKPEVLLILHTGQCVVLKL